MAYLTGVLFPRLSETGVQVLESDLTLEEVKVAYQSLPLGKSPGNDGFTTERYQTFAITLTLRLFDAHADLLLQVISLYIDFTGYANGDELMKTTEEFLSAC
ncbi:hypothetical protein NDU88_002143 [Pleurodeles waltl]|uniref:Uncharacterized protein n=1 Tax=Pleurodeles waltl TaxID=8319 RepID=A0AAV7U8K5_PLEWA|nr:hypothetical protein NDU88_002143 [Pleurodeles waltl]